jgi:hypothetical protein
MRRSGSSLGLGTTRGSSSIRRSTTSSTAYRKGEKACCHKHGCIQLITALSDHGVICTLDNPVYLTRVKGKVIHCLDRGARPKTIPFDPTEYRFKLALSRNNYDEMLHIIKTSNLLGQSIIAYLQQKGFPEIALHFVQDQNMRFDLALECGNLDVAYEMAQTLNRKECWERLAQQALKQGNHKVGLPVVSICGLQLADVLKDRRVGLPEDPKLRAALVLIPRHRQPRQVGTDAGHCLQAGRPYVQVPQRSVHWRRQDSHLGVARSWHA